MSGLRSWTGREFHKLLKSDSVENRHLHNRLITYFMYMCLADLTAVNVGL